MGHLYTPFKIFHFKDKIDSLPADNPAILAPLHIRIKPTNVCNHNCWYCAYRSSDLQLGKDMVQRDTIPRNKMLEIIDDVIAMQVKAVTFSGGGEPFCYPHLLETCRRLADSEVQFAALSNGSRVTGEIAELFAHHGTWLRISMDSWDDESCSKYRGVKDGEFTRILNNLEAFRSYGGRCLLGVSFIVDKDNAPHLFQVARQIKETGAHSLKISPCIVSNEGAENNAYHAPIFDSVRQEILRVRDELEDSSFEIFDAYHELDHKFAKPYDWCPYLQILPVIGADLRVYSCQDKAYNLECGVLGSIKDVRFRDFWFNGKDKFFSIKPKRDCNHHCVANRKNLLLHEYLDADAEHLGFV